MDDPTCSGTCLMKTDLQNTTDKLAFLKDNWPSFGQIESIDESSKQDLNCTLCFLNVLIDEFVDDASPCSDRVMARLVLTREYVQNAIEIIKLKAGPPAPPPWRPWTPCWKRMPSSNSTPAPCPGATGQLPTQRPGS